MFFEGKAEFRQPHAFRNLEEVYPDGQPLPRIDDSDRIEFFESQRFRTGAKKKKQKKKTPEPPRVDAETGPETAEKKAFERLGRAVIEDALADEFLQLELKDLDVLNRIKKMTEIIKDNRTIDPTLAPARPGVGIDSVGNVARLEDDVARLDAQLREAIDDIDQYEKLIEFIKNSDPEVQGIIDALIERFNREATTIPEGGIDAEPAEDAEDADVEVVGVSNVEVVGVSKKDPAKKQVKVKVEPEEVIEPESESDVDSVDEDTEETQVLDAALKTLPKIK